MAIINRISRLFKADFHAVLDRIEEPDVLLKQAVREMEDALLEREQCIKQMDLEYTHLLERQNDLEQSVLGMDDELEVCFAADNEELARNLIKRKLESQIYLKSILRKRETLERSLKETRALLSEEQAKYESMKQKLELLSDEIKASTSYDCESAYATVAECSVGKDEIEIAFLKEKRRFDQRGNLKKPQSKPEKGASL